MAKKEHPLQLLEQFLPESTFPYIKEYFDKYTIHLTLTRERRSVLGDYRSPTKEKPVHRISININLNAYSFLITLLHELAHMLTYIEKGPHHQPHGEAWKGIFSAILKPFVLSNTFPDDVKKALTAYLDNPNASTCTDIDLFKALYQYDRNKNGYDLLDNIARIHTQFRMEDGRIFQVIKRQRTRYLCLDIASGKRYLVPSITEVTAVTGT